MNPLVVGVVASVVAMATTAAMLRWANPLRPVLGHYRKLCFVQQEAIHAAAEVVQALLIRTAGMLRCDACGEPMEHGQEPCIRDGDRGILIGHATCFPPEGP
jgi:hypothetical protein